MIRAEDGDPVLIDFGSARSAAGEKTRHLTAVHTPGYAPIEQYSASSREGPATDVYGLAAVSYRALTGESPPAAPDRMIDDKCRPLAQQVGGADRAWLEALDRGLALRPEDRPETVEAWRAALASAGDAADRPLPRSGGSPSFQERPGDVEAPPSSSWLRPSFRKAVYGLAAVLLMASLVVTGVVVQRQRAEAHYRLGDRYHKGNGVAQDLAEAARWYRQAADQDHPDAQAALGLLYARGDGVAQDFAEAARWFRQAADQGHAGAQGNLGNMYRRGDGVAQDYSEAVRWYRQAADQGRAGSQAALGSMYDRGDGVAQDYPEAARWYRQAAEQGHAGAQAALGSMYDRGDGVAQDYSEAARWYRQAAEQGHAEAQGNLGTLYRRGDGVAQDSAEAARWYRQAAEQGDADAQAALGVMYATGDYATGDAVAEDYVSACMWLDLAAARTTGELRNMVVALRDALASRMTPRQIEEAQRRAREWRPRTDPSP